MNNNQAPLDASARKEALNPSQSFIVQAPAGSGKTELLTQRFLSLLSHVEHPESILAITFTRKAAKEMIHRIQNALMLASSASPPDSEHERHTYQLAKTALENDARRNWQLCKHIHKLNIMTIDSFCLSITQKMPIKSGLCKISNITPDPLSDYYQASQQMMALLEVDSPYQEHLMTLLMHLDHHESHLIQLFIKLLGTRDQWLPILLSQQQNPLSSLKNHMQSTLKKLHGHVKQQISDAIPIPLQQKIASLCAFAGKNLSESQSSIAECASLASFPSQDHSHEVWLGLMQCLLTQDNQWRKTVDKRCGFPTSTSVEGTSVEGSPDKNEKAFWKSQKANMLDAIESLKQYPGLLSLLQHCRQLPPQIISDVQWKTLKSLLKILPALAAQCQIIFNQKGHVDYIEIASSALAALEHDNEYSMSAAPSLANNESEVALSLDYQLQHILIDEFQDTSPQQYALVHALVNEWSSTDSKTLFLVGDPMQSIYRFRQADVSLFLKAKSQGIGPVNLKYLSLTTNFRSHPKLITWINQSIGQLFSKHNHANDGAIAYAPSQSMPHKEVATENSLINETFQSGSATVNAIISEHADAEVHWIIEKLQLLSTQYPQDSIAILVRARSHLPLLLNALRQAKLPFQGVELSSLANHPLSMDLQSLTLALIFPNYPLAWMSLLRGPLCGLSLASLLEIQESPAEHPWDKILHIKKLTDSEDQKNLDRLKDIMTRSIEMLNESKIAHVVHRTFLALGGPNCYPEDESICQIFIQILEHTADLSSPERLMSALKSKLISQQESAQIQIMTMHKAKGLEFDHVFLPFGHKQAPPKAQPLLLWQANQSNSSLLMSPLSDKNTESDPLYAYLQFCESKKNAHELVRLLYVACTRAKKTLTLSSHSVHETLKFHPSTFAYRLQKLYQIIDWHKASTPPDSIEGGNTTIQKKKQKIRSNWVSNISLDTLLPTPIFSKIPQNALISAQQESKRYESSILGECLHQTLQSMGKIPPSQWTESWLDAQDITWQKQLAQFGLTDIENLCNRMHGIIKKTMSDPVAQWILRSDHTQAESEYALNHWNGDFTETLVLDRTFIHEGVRWIIDFKSSPVDAVVDKNEFARQAQSKHQEQLHRYANALRAIEALPIQCGLYFPDGNLWHHWSY